MAILHAKGCLWAGTMCWCTAVPKPMLLVHGVRRARVHAAQTQAQAPQCAGHPWPCCRLLLLHASLMPLLAQAFCIGCQASGLLRVGTAT